MQIVLLENLGNLGKLGDVVHVKNGYARNFLIPQGMAKRATPENLAEFERRRVEFEARQTAAVNAAKEKQEKLNEQSFTIAQKAGVDGRLFGSVTTIDIARVVTDSGVEVKRSGVRLPNGPLRSTGEYDIEISLGHEQVATIKVIIVPEEEKA